MLMRRWVVRNDVEFDVVVENYLLLNSLTIYLSSSLSLSANQFCSQTRELVDADDDYYEE